MSDILLAKAYDLRLSGKKQIVVQNLNHNLVLDDLGDNVTNNQVLAKRLVYTYRKLSLRVMEDSAVLYEAVFNITNRQVAPSKRVWTTVKDDITIRIRPGLSGMFQDKWVLDENGAISLYTTETTETLPWNAVWNVFGSVYEGATSVTCSMVQELAWGVVPISSIAGGIGGGSGEATNWSTV